MQARHVGAVFKRIVGRAGAGSPDMAIGAKLAKRLGGAIADTTGAADHQHGLAGEIECIGERGRENRNAHRSICLRVSLI